MTSLSGASVSFSGKWRQKRGQVNVVLRIRMRKHSECRVARVWGGPHEEDDLLGKIRGAQVWASVLQQVLLFADLEECELGPFCSSPDSQLRGRSPVYTGPGEHLWGCVLLVGGALVCGRSRLPPHLHQTCALCSRYTCPWPQLACC